MFSYATPYVLDAADGIVGVEGFALFTPVTQAPRIDFVSVFSTPPLSLESENPAPSLRPIDFDPTGFPEGSIGIQKGMASTSIQDSSNFLLAKPGLDYRDIQRLFFAK